MKSAQEEKNEKIIFPCFLQGVDRVNGYFPDAVWYDYETVRCSVFLKCGFAPVAWMPPFFKEFCVF